MTRIATYTVIIALSGCLGTGDMPPYDAATDTPPDTHTDEHHDPDTTPDTTPDIEDEDTDNDCLPEQTPIGSAGHLAGTACVSCHLSAWPILTLGGTIYTDTAGTAPLVGSTIIITDSSGSEIQLVSHFNGNFFTEQAVVFPLTVFASRCPDHVMMDAPVTSGECNSCHAFGSRIHLP